MILDVFVAIVVSLGFYLGYSRGLIKTVFDSLSLIIGILAALKLSPIVINILQSFLKISPAMTFLLGVVITFIGVLALIRFFGKKIESALEAVNINFINKIAGGVLQSLFFAYLLSLAFWLLSTIKVLSPEVQKASMTYSLLEPLPEKGKKVFVSLRPVFQGFWDKAIEAMDNIKSKSENQNPNG
ncbi:MAG: CvpA family protein [Saprospiraceae bacterium]|nr:CvpA family protein [Saprospiraceae bacterium]MBK8372042.1 CvpA family protein [Saprospiraceae bacterium]MBK8547312.1 CvpA family protein [Saprospiraceae bacterium]